MNRLILLRRLYLICPILILFVVNTKCIIHPNSNKMLLENQNSSSIHNDSHGKYQPSFVNEDICELKHCSVIVHKPALLTNFNYPDGDTGRRSFSYVWRINFNKCGLRITFVDVNITDRNIRGMCDQDRIDFFIPASEVTSQCGVLNNYQLSLPAKTGEHVQMRISLQGDTYKWKIYAVQIPCSSISTRPLENPICGKRRTNLKPTAIVKDDNINMTETDSSNEESLSNATLFTHAKDSQLDLLPKCRNHPMCQHDDMLRRKAADRNYSKIIGGHEAKEKVPWQAVLLIKNGRDYEYVCSAALLSTRFVITKAHCLIRTKVTPVRSLRVALDVHDLRTDIKSKNLFSVKYVSVHTRYVNIFYDVALLYLDRPVVFDDISTIAPICLPYSNNLYVNSSALVTGYGKTTYNASTTSPILNEANFTTISNQQCILNYLSLGLNPSTFDMIRDDMICAGDNSSATCWGDDGSLLQAQQNGIWQLIGLASYPTIRTCLIQDLILGIFSRVSYFVDWIALCTAIIGCDGLYGSIVEAVVYRGCTLYQ